MESPVISVLILTSLISSTSQDCYDVLHTDQSNCFRSNGRTFYTHYSRPCNDYHVTQCSAIIHRIQSRIKNLVHKIIVNSGDIETLNRTLLCGFCKLESITITGSNISNIQLYSFSNLLALQSVHLTNNVVGVLSQGQLNSNSLEILDLSNNSIRSFENISLNLDILSSLNLSNNPLFYVKDPSIDLFQNTLKLQSLNLSLTGIKQIHIGTFSKLANLRILDLSQNNLTALPKGIFHDLKNLMQLYLNHNRLKYFQYEGLTNLAKIDLNANLFTCDTLVDIISISIRIGVHIINGNTRNTKNTFGIDCMDSDPAKSQDIEFFIKVEQIIQELLLQQANTSIFLATNQQNRSDAYWRNLTQDFKGYLGTMQQTTKDTIYKLTTIFTSSMNTSTVKIDELGGTLKTELSNFVRGIRSNFELFLSRLENNFQEINQYIKEIHGLRNSSYKIDASFINLFNNFNEKMTSANQSYKALVIGTYAIFIILVVAFVLLMLLMFRFWKNIKSKPEECNPLTSITI